MKKTQINSIDELYVLGDKILIEAIRQTEADGVLKGITSDNKAEQGVILAVGDETNVAKIGYVILFNRYSTTKFVINGKEYQVLKEEDIVGYKYD